MEMIQDLERSAVCLWAASLAIAEWRRDATGRLRIAVDAFSPAPPPRE